MDGGGGCGCGRGLSMEIPHPCDDRRHGDEVQDVEAVRILVDPRLAMDCIHRCPFLSEVTTADSVPQTNRGDSAESLGPKPPDLGEDSIAMAPQNVLGMGAGGVDGVLPHQLAGNVGNELTITLGSHGSLLGGFPPHSDSRSGKSVEDEVSSWRSSRPLDRLRIKHSTIVLFCQVLLTVNRAKISILSSNSYRCPAIDGFPDRDRSEDAAEAVRFPCSVEPMEDIRGDVFRSRVFQKVV